MKTGKSFHVTFQLLGLPQTKIMLISLHMCMNERVAENSKFEIISFFLF